MDIWKVNRNTYYQAYFEDVVSVVWTERYNAYGDFEITVPPSQDALDFFTKGSWLMTPDSDKIMEIKSVSIASDQEGVQDEMKVVGVSLEAFLLDRVTHLPPPQPTSLPGAAAVWHVNNVFRTASFPSNNRDLMSNFYAENLAVGVGEDVKLWSFREPLYNAVKDILDPWDIGFRVVSKSTSNNQVWFQTYVGVDRTEDQSVRAPVRFSPEDDNVVGIEYLSSIQDLKNIAYVHFTAANYVQIPAPGVNLSVSGFDRKVLYVDGSQLPEEDTDAARALGLAELKKYNEKSAVDGLVANDSGYIFGTDYGLGDLVTVKGSYGVKANMRVAEYIRAFDHQGERGYPTLVNID